MREIRQQPSKRKHRSSSEDVAYEFDESSSSESNSVADNDVSALAERKPSLIARELARYNIDIAAISETHLSDTGELSEHLGGYTYYWSGRPAGERAGSGVGFAIRNSLARDLSELPKGVNDRLMTLRMPISNNKYAHLISAYAPTLPSADEDKELFYQHLRKTLENIPICDKVILLGDFNARVGTDCDIWNGALGKHEIGKCNDNGLRLLSLCAQFNLSITNTYFRLADKYKTSWMHPRSKHWHLLDYIIVRQKDLRDVLVTRAMRGAVGWTDHRLIRSKMRLQLKAPRRAQNKIPPKLAFSNLITSQELGKTLDLKFAASAPEPDQGNVDGEWKSFAKHLHDCALDILGKPQKRNQDWFDESDEEIRTLVKRHRHELNSKQIHANSNRDASRKLKCKVRELKDKSMAAK
ncbi:craniofacial development protein 2-like [Trichoplusia ni]|uniref:Craniofacial development protein 2-like n=1 Tax=Trichoplusia ni TaxID=7111 RepID=A0A7E5WZ52_TRINI|nr:craniofacial development protein 2-like [Trichoplusia ni]